MYHPQVIAQNAQKLEAAYRTALQPHTLSEVESWIGRLADVVDHKGKTTRELTNEEEAWILNETLLCKVDFSYFAGNYAKINVKGHGLRTMAPFLETQQFILKKMGELELAGMLGERRDGILINLLKGARQVGGCLRPDTRILTADLRWITLDSVVAGQELVSVDESTPGGRGIARKLRRTVVEAKRELVAPVYEVFLENGGRLVATADHRFLSHMRGATTTCWRRVNQMGVGDRIRYVVGPWSSHEFEDGWVGGLIDGEGSLRRRSSQKEGRLKAGGCELTISQGAGTVLDRAVAYFTRLGMKFRVDVDRREAGTSSKLGNKDVYKIVMGRLEDIFAIVGMTRPSRFSDSGWWEGREPPQTKDQGWSRILAIVPLGPERVIDLQTSTKTYIAEGFVSHNSTLAEAVIGHRVVTQSNLFGLLASDVPGERGSGYLFDMLERIIENLPWWLAPELTEHVKNAELKTAAGCNVWVDAGKSMKGAAGARGQLGRMKTISLCHLSELSTWERPQQIDSALLPTIPVSPRVFFMKESTAKGRNNWWHKDWKVARAGKSRFLPVFIPWYVEKKYATPAPVGWQPAETTLVHAKRCEETSHRWVGQRVHLTRDQLYWYEFTRAYYEEKQVLKTFLEEFGAADDEECFQFTGASLFAPEVLQRVEDQARPILAVLEVGPWEGRGAA